MKSAVLPITCLLLAVPCRAQLDSRTDTFDILHTAIHLDISDIPSQSIEGYAELTIVPRVANPGTLRLDLLELTVDSVLVNSVATSFTYNDTVLAFASTALTITDTVRARIFYSGNPQGDASGWGGFYFQSGYAFNLGVGFAANPHNYGRVWFPCFDAFTEKSTFSFAISTVPTDRAICNGHLVSVDTLPGGNYTYNWELLDPIPSYLVSVAITNYTTAKYDYPGIAATYPVELNARAGDTSNAKASFINLNGALAAFEDRYGPNPFEKVGYSFVPFNSGAMEHPTNIAFPVALANGTLAGEKTMAHELAHHWWGDWVTCESAEEMWINEGWASYSEFIFLEWVYGESKYWEDIRANHRNMLHSAHISDGVYLPISGVDHENTYGTHIYKKGADMIHTLRTFMGDSLFLDCIPKFLADFGWKNANSIQFRDHLTNCSGINLMDFFDGWIFRPGWSHFGIDHWEIIDSGSTWTTRVFIRQRLNNRSEMANSVPLTLSVYGQTFNRYDRNVTASGLCSEFLIQTPVKPKYIGLDMEGRISDATSDDFRIINSTGNQNFSNGMMTINVDGFPEDSILLRVIHNWVAPDLPRRSWPGVHLSDYRFWTVEGLFSDSLDATATLNYNGSIGASGNLDNYLITNSEDSLLLLYRPSPIHDWWVYPDYTLNVMGSVTNKSGKIEISRVRAGEYCLAIRDAGRSDTFSSTTPNCSSQMIGIQRTAFNPRPFTVFPNPAMEMVTIQVSDARDDKGVAIYNIIGEVMLDTVMRSGEYLHSFSTRSWPAGNYFVMMQRAGEALGTVKLVLTK